MMHVEIKMLTKILFVTQVGFVNSLAFAKSGQFLIAGVGQVSLFILYDFFYKKENAFFFPFRFSIGALIQVSLVFILVYLGCFCLLFVSLLFLHFSSDLML